MNKGIKGEIEEMINNAMQINERLVKISAGVVPVEQELELGQDVQLTISGNITKVEHLDQQDGTINVVYVVKGMISYVNDEEVTA